MKSMIKELWCGNIMPPEDSRKNTLEMKQLLEYISRHNDDLLKTMTDEQKKISSRSSRIAGVNTQVSPTRHYSNMPSSLGRGWHWRYNPNTMNENVLLQDTTKIEVVFSFFIRHAP